MERRVFCLPSLVTCLPADFAPRHLVDPTFSIEAWKVVLEDPALVSVTLLRKGVDVQRGKDSSASAEWLCPDCVRDFVSIPHVESSKSPSWVRECRATLRVRGLAGCVGPSDAAFCRATNTDFGSQRHQTQKMFLLLLHSPYILHIFRVIHLHLHGHLNLHQCSFPYTLNLNLNLYIYVDLNLDLDSRLFLFFQPARRA